MAFLTVRGSEGRRVYELPETVVLGRGVSADIQVDDPRASKRHAEIREVGGRFLLCDLGSTNGTELSDERIEGEVALQDGDEIRIGNATLVFTRTVPPGAVQTPDGERKGKKKEKRTTGRMDGPLPKKGSGRMPKGTMVIPLERFGLRPSMGRGFETTVLSAPDVTLDLGMWLRSLYRLLREANQCESEDALFAAATRILGEALPGSRVRVVFEAEGATEDAGEEARKGKHEALQLAVWSDPARRSGKTTRIMEDRLARARTILLTHARARCVAVLSPDAEADVRVREDSGSRKKGPRVSARHLLEEEEGVDRTSLLIAPLLAGRTALGYLVVERSYRVGPPGRGRRGDPFNQAHLEFIAAAAYPLATMLENIRRRQKVLNQNKRLRETVMGRQQIVGNAPRLKAALDVVERIAPFDSPVLILGASGTGKELVARAIHALSSRRDGPFEAINCAALPENLVESELFGHAKGSFTGASADRSGIFETASGGTLFLDEIGELPGAVQAKLLRVLEESKISRVGESRLRDIDCRILTATNRDLAADVEEGHFRRDLYYRLRVMEVALPALRERLEDLPALCKHLLAPFGNFHLQPEVLDVFRRYAWPGNVRELRNTLERMAVLSRPAGRGFSRGGMLPLGIEDIPLDIRQAVSASGAAQAAAVDRRGQTLRIGEEAPAPAQGGGFLVSQAKMRPLEELQVDYARWVLQQVNGNKTKAAKVLGIQRSTLYAWTEWKDKKKKK